jgi:hypothetical protein
MYMKITKSTRAALIRTIADCRKEIATSTDADVLFYARKGLEECTRALFDASR